MSEPIDWAALCEEVADARLALCADGGERPTESLVALGLDAEAFQEWATSDAIDSLALTREHAQQSGLPFTVVVAGMLATHTQMGVELGIALVKRGLVR